jgi:hypothetical protein
VHCDLLHLLNNRKGVDITASYLERHTLVFWRSLHFHFILQLAMKSAIVRSPLQTVKCSDKRHLCQTYRIIAPVRQPLAREGSTRSENKLSLYDGTLCIVSLLMMQLYRRFGCKLTRCTARGCPPTQSALRAGTRFPACKPPRGAVLSQRATKVKCVQHSNFVSEAHTRKHSWSR